MIPTNINHGHILKAANRVEKEGIKRGRKARKYLVQINNRYYPMKLIISCANEFANGIELQAKKFTAEEAKRFLIKRVFDIIPIQ